MNPTTPTPDQIANVTEAIQAALWLGVALAIYAYLSHRTEDNGPTRWHRWRAWVSAHYLLSSSDPADGEAAHSANQSVYQRWRQQRQQSDTTIAQRMIDRERR